jgi:hypothetical protein
MVIRKAAKKVMGLKPGTMTSPIDDPEEVKKD